MNQMSMGTQVAKLFRFFSIVIMTVSLFACGGGGGSAGSAGSVSGGSVDSQSPNGKIQLSLVDQAGVESSHISGSSGLLAKAKITNSSGASVGPGVIVTFTLEGAIAVLSSTAGTALTGSDGIATIGMKAGVGTGAGTLTASAVLVGTTSVSAKATFDVSSPNATPVAINFVAAVPSDKSIVIKGAGGILRSEVALLTFAVVDSSNLGIANVKVNFSMLPGTDVVLGASNGITDPSGKVTVTVSSGNSVTTVVVNATVDGTLINTKSDTIAVTTGLVNNAHFDIYPEKLNLEAFNIAGIENKITAFLADANGGVVADGMPVAFTTDSGAIVGDDGTKDTARCLTKNGACSVIWRSQAPFSSTPTVFATVSNGVVVLAKSTQFTANASYGMFVGLPVTVNFLCTTPPAPQSFDFSIVDQNGYSMPTGTTFTPLDLTNVTATVFPATVTAKAAVSLGGTGHSITITPKASCAAGDKGHLFLELTSPKGSKSGAIRIDIVYQ
ncbi:MAG: hypothetical protein Q7R66_02640 [Undibacterium sp.]|uniref:hypothetical protein n=1 Tax=Undibacterium sp. TaxID=1914977 RepID=UPI002723717A|nr:hypothetical protein [Undibacterium sp.]MDO8651069.1 hypothetical protein [Undibacterium sp.]